MLNSYKNKIEPEPSFEINEEVEFELSRNLLPNSSTMYSPRWSGNIDCGGSGIWQTR